MDDSDLAVRQFVNLLQENPTLMPEAPEHEDRDYLSHLATTRALNEEHDCLRCGCMATGNLIATTTAGYRWMDLCGVCWLLVSRLGHEHGRME